MTSRPLVDPEILPLLDLMPTLELSDQLLPLVREARYGCEPPPLPIAPHEHLAPGLDDAPDVPVRHFDPPARTGNAAVFHIHGGGMVLGKAEMSDPGNAMLALALGVQVFSVDYRLAPEHPFPAPQNDCLAAWDWLQANAQSLGVDPARIAIAGESAGGGLAAALALMIRDTGRTPPAGQVLTFPMLDHRTGSDEQPALANTGEFVWSAQSNRFGWAALRGNYPADDDRAHWFSPALAPDLAGLPPAWIGVGALDLFLAEDLDYAKRLAAAGVPVSLDLYAGCPHAFMLVQDAAVTADYARDLKAAYTRFLGL